MNSWMLHIKEALMDDLAMSTHNFDKSACSMYTTIKTYSPIRPSNTQTTRSLF